LLRRESKLQQRNEFGVNRHNSIDFLLVVNSFGGILRIRQLRMVQLELKPDLLHESSGELIEPGSAERPPRGDVGGVGVVDLFQINRRKIGTDYDRIASDGERELELAKREAELAKFYGDRGSISWGNQIRSYVLQPYQMCKDLRTDVETSDVQGVLDGDLDPFIEGYLKMRKDEGVKR
jgi:hypothetical protein